MLFTTERETDRDGGGAEFDVVCVGESMAAFTPETRGPLADVTRFHRGIGGAESNVACYLARYGHRARWVSRVGTDPFGDHLLAEIAACGVDVRAVERDPHRPTGIYFKERLADRTGVLYHRAGSAASAMSPEGVAGDGAMGSAVRSGRVLHLSGITAALSAPCLALLRTLTARRPGRPVVSFDVNHRPALWRSGDPAVLAELARDCDVVFVGEDEAREAWGLRDADAVRAALPEPGLLVVKRGPDGAIAYASGAPAVEVPAPRVEVVEPVGAGDAFAAGFLSGCLRGLPMAHRLRHGHLLAAAALTVHADLGTPPARDDADALVALDEAAWRGLRLAAGWTEGGVETEAAGAGRTKAAGASRAETAGRTEVAP
ncbi:sugar kinase [Streptantibioticus parmotrematis]|uniref:sugar kinase n=1 Tax=Streptantibioticus parmotrematis TaxID=2873249 RepID=UPI003410C74F